MPNALKFLRVPVLAAALGAAGLLALPGTARAQADDDAPAASPALVGKPTAEESEIVSEAERLVTGGDAERALARLESAVEDSPKSAPLRLALVRLAVRVEGPEAAMRRIKAAQAHPDLKGQSVWHQQEAILWSALRQKDRAVAAIDKAIELNPKHLEHRREKVDILLLSNDPAAALAETDAILKDGHDAWWLHHQRGLAIIRKDKDDKADAVAEFDKALALADKEKDERVAEFVLRGIGALAGPDEALGRVKPRLAKDPKYTWRLLSIALYRTKKDYETATKDVRALLEKTKDAPATVRSSVLRAAADVLHSAPTPDIAGARAAYEELVKLEPDDATVLNNLAYLLVDDVDPPEPKQAKRYSSQAFARAKTVTVGDTHGWVLILSGGDDVAEGVRILELAAKQDPDVPEVFYHLGEGYLRLPEPRTDDALKMFERAVELIQKRRDAGESERTDDKTLKQVAEGLAKAKKLRAEKKGEE